ncbi:MAG: hypothetical protein AB1480_18360 [Nitrospirota bacterium]
MEYGRLRIFRVILVGALFFVTGCMGAAKTMSNAATPTWKEKVLFVDERKITQRESTFDIYIANPDGTDLKVLVEQGIQPSPSPDGSRVGFMALTKLYWKHTGISVVNNDGSERKDLVQIKGCEFFISQYHWSPDGKKIAYLVGCEEIMKRPELWVVTLDGDKQKICDLDKDMFYLISWSPDGKELLVFYFDGSRAFIVDTISLKKSEINLKGLNIINPQDFFPPFLIFFDDENLIYYGDDKSLWIVKKDGSKTRRLLENINFMWPETLRPPLVFSPSGKIKFISYGGDTKKLRYSYENGQKYSSLYEIDIKSKTATKVFEKPGTFRGMLWSPVSNKVLYGTSVIDLDTGRKIVIKDSWNRMPSEIFRLWDDFTWLVSPDGGENEK